MPTDRCFNSVKKLGFPLWDQLKGIVGTVEVLAYKAMSFAMDHFALECACGSIFQCMFGGFFFFFFFACASLPSSTSSSSSPAAAAAEAAAVAAVSRVM